MKQQKISEKNDPVCIDKVIFRHVLYEDLEELEWDGEYSHLRRVYASAYQRSKEGRNVLWVADHPTAGIIGQVFIQLISSRTDLADGNIRAYLYAFRIRKQYRNMGLGTKMIALVEKDLLRRGFSEITLNVSKENKLAIRLYEKVGFQIEGHESGEWTFRDQYNRLRHVVEPAWKMVKVIYSP